MHTAAELSLPVPRRIASRPVDWMAVTSDEGAALPVMATSCEGRSVEMWVTPGREESEVRISVMQDSQVMGTASVVSNGGIGDMVELDPVAVSSNCGAHCGRASELVIEMLEVMANHDASLTI